MSELVRAQSERHGVDVFEHLRDEMSLFHFTGCKQGVHHVIRAIAQRIITQAHSQRNNAWSQQILSTEPLVTDDSQSQESPQTVSERPGDSLCEEAYRSFEW